MNRLKWSVEMMSVCCGISLSAQGTLQFNQVKLVTTQETVPAGKVWKVESAMLGLSQGIRVSPWFNVNGDTIVLGYDSYNVSRWENVVSIQIQGRAQSVCGTVQLHLRILGSGGNQAIDQTFVTNVTASTNWTTLATHVPNSAGNNEIDRWALWNYIQGSTAGGNNWEFRIVVNLANGSQIVNVYSGGAPGGCYNYSSGINYSNYVASATSTLAIDRMERTRPQISTSFPFWLPAGSTLGAGGNIKGLSVIEFNVQP